MMTKRFLLFVTSKFHYLVHSLASTHYLRAYTDVVMELTLTLNLGTWKHRGMVTGYTTLTGEYLGTHTHEIAGTLETTVSMLAHGYLYYVSLDAVQGGYKALPFVGTVNA